MWYIIIIHTHNQLVALSGWSMMLNKDNKFHTPSLTVTLVSVSLPIMHILQSWVMSRSIIIINYYNLSKSAKINVQNFNYWKLQKTSPSERRQPISQPPWKTWWLNQIESGMVYKAIQFNDQVLLCSHVNFQPLLNWSKVFS